jgi:glycosyltransferase involved in cell wall biosynthesis
VGAALRRFEPDLIHAVNPFVLGWGALYFSRKLGVPLLASYHTNVAAYARFYGLDVFDRVTRWHTRRLHNRAAVNLCTSEATLRYLRQEGIERLHLWPQGVDAAHFHPGRFSKDWRIRLTQGHPGERLLLYVGRLSHEKDIGRLRAVLDGVAGVRLALVGDGPARRDLEEEFAGTPAVFMGVLQGDELATAFASADAFVFPSTTETLGMAMIEALASGLPVLAARTGATGEVVTDGETGLLYDPTSEASLIAAVEKLVSDDGLRGRLGENARAAAERRDWRSSTRTLRGYYEQALGERSSP